MVEAVCPSNHPLTLTNAVKVFYRFRPFSAEASLRAAIDKSQPDLVIPCDDVAAGHLRHMDQAAAASSSARNQALHALLTRSLGDPASYPILESRGKFIAVARESGVPVPETEEVTNAEQVRAWCKRSGFPAVLKADGTSGGQGVRIANTLDEAVSAFERLHAPNRLAVALKRALIDRDLNLILPWWRRERHGVTIQKYVSGKDFNISVACWKGEVLAAVGAEVLETWRPNGPAAVIRLQPNGPMLQVAQTIVRRLNLSGLCGFDFLVDPQTQTYTLLEINPRSTQTGHIPLGVGHDLPSALYTALTGEAREPEAITTNDKIALFPLAWQSPEPRIYLATAYPDIPTVAPDLVRAGEAETELLLRSKWVQWVQLWANAWIPGSPFRLSRQASK